MKKILLLTVLSAILGLGGFSQTKKIAHRSHAGKDAAFTIGGDDNFGNPPPRDTSNKKSAKKIETKVDSTPHKVITRKKHGKSKAKTT